MQSKLKTICKFYKDGLIATLSVWAGCADQEKLSKSDRNTIGIAVLILVLFGLALNYSL